MPLISRKKEVTDFNKVFTVRVKPGPAIPAAAAVYSLAAAALGPRLGIPYLYAQQAVNKKASITLTIRMLDGHAPITTIKTVLGISENVVEALTGYEIVVSSPEPGVFEEELMTRLYEIEKRIASMPYALLIIGQARVTALYDPMLLTRSVKYPWRGWSGEALPGPEMLADLRLGHNDVYYDQGPGYTLLAASDGIYATLVIAVNPLPPAQVLKRIKLERRAKR